MRLYQYGHNLNPFAGLAESAGTSVSVFFGDAQAATWSLTTASATASRWTLQGSDAEGFVSSIGADTWFDLRGVTAQGFYSVDSLPRWGRFQRTVSASSSTILTAYRVGG